MNAIDKILQEIKTLAGQIGRSVKLMEVCGTHTQVIAEYGLKSFLPSNITLVSGPGCPVCVTAQEDIDNIVELALKGVPIAAYGDVLRVPGTKMSLEEARSKGAWVKEVYSVNEALDFKKKDLVFFAIGFETTAPMTASAVKRGLNIFSAHKFFPPAMDALLKSGEINIDGFIDPGHVSAIIGLSPYKQLKTKTGKKIAQVVTGFTLEDVLMGIYFLLKQIKEGRTDVENEYSRCVAPLGNIAAQKLIQEVFEPSNSNWRGFGVIPKSGMELKKKFAKQNAKIIYKDILKKLKATSYPPASLSPARRDGGRGKLQTNFCRCGEVIRGVFSPRLCPLFSKVCQPQNPQGPCMVSMEGACNVEFKHRSNNRKI